MENQDNTTAVVNELDGIILRMNAIGKALCKPHEISDIIREFRGLSEALSKLGQEEPRSTEHSAKDLREATPPYSVEIDSSPSCSRFARLITELDGLTESLHTGSSLNDILGHLKRTTAEVEGLGRESSVGNVHIPMNLPSAGNRDLKR